MCWVKGPYHDYDYIHNINIDSCMTHYIKTPEIMVGQYIRTLKKFWTNCSFISFFYKNSFSKVSRRRKKHLSELETFFDHLNVQTCYMNSKLLTYFGGFTFHRVVRH